jgi:hypothetical protein
MQHQQGRNNLEAGSKQYMAAKHGGLLVTTPTSVLKICIYAKTPSLGKGAAACEVAGRGYLRQCLSHKPLPAPSRWEGIAHIHRFFVFRTRVVDNTDKGGINLR